MQFAENYFTGGKADPNHRPKYKTCLIRIPETYNSKCLNKGLSLEQSKVNILQKWNGKRINSETLVHEFRIWLTQQEINLNREKIKKLPMRKQDYQYFSDRRNQRNNVSKIDWIETLLQTPIEDYRKDCLWRIIGPYLLKILSFYLKEKNNNNEYLNLTVLLLHCINVYKVKTLRYSMWEEEFS